MGLGYLSLEARHLHTTLCVTTVDSTPQGKMHTDYIYQIYSSYYMVSYEANIMTYANITL